MVASFLLFPKHVGIGHPLGAALVFGSAFVTLKKPGTAAKQREAVPLLPTHAVTATSNGGLSARTSARAQ